MLVLGSTATSVANDFASGTVTVGDRDNEAAPRLAGGLVDII